MPTLPDIIINFAASLWHVTQMVFLYNLAGMTIISVIYLIYRIEQEVAKDKANKK
jgi:hypothetical protein